MATTNQNLVLYSGSTPIFAGTASVTPPFISALDPNSAFAVTRPDQTPSGSGTPTTPNNAAVIDRFVFDPSITAPPPTGAPYSVPANYGDVIGGGSKNGAVYLTFTGTTPQTVSLLNTTTNTPAATGGDTVFATCYAIRVKNTGSAAITLAPGASNPSPIPAFTGTTPTVSIPAGATMLFTAPAGVSITSSACNITFTPTSGGSLAMTICGG